LYGSWKIDKRGKERKSLSRQGGRIHRERMQKEEQEEKREITHEEDEGRSQVSFSAAPDMGRACRLLVGLTEGKLHAAPTQV